MGRDEKALPASGMMVSGNENRPETGTAQRMLVPEPSGRIHAAFDDRRPAANAGPVRRSSTVTGTASSPRSPPTIHSSRRRRLTTISTLSMQASSVSATGAPRPAPDRECGTSSK